MVAETIVEVFERLRRGVYIRITELIEVFVNAAIHEIAEIFLARQALLGGTRFEAFR